MLTILGTSVIYRFVTYRNHLPSLLTGAIGVQSVALLKLGLDCGLDFEGQFCYGVPRPWPCSLS
jgi:hypothetical protein